MKTEVFHAVLFLWVLTISSVVCATALDDYVATPDASFDWNQVGPSEYDGDWLANTTAYNLQLISQTWRDGSEVTPTTWTHWVTVIVPGGLLIGTPKDTALVLINGGDIGEPAPIIDPSDPSHAYADFRNLAMGTRTVIVELRSVPNQPLVFADEDPNERSEDEIIAYSWDKFLNGGHDYQPAPSQTSRTYSCPHTDSGHRPRSRSTTNDGQSFAACSADR